MSAAPTGLPALRVGVAVAVPTLALTAHGAAAGMLPGSAGVLLTAAAGLVLAALVGSPRERRIPPARIALLLLVGQVVGHPAASVGELPAAHAGPSATMIAWHAVAIPLSAALLVAVAHVYAVLTAAIEALATGPYLAAPRLRPAPVLRWRPLVAIGAARAAPRAPPRS
ncbi:MAG: YtxH domain-containing protein [Gordonia sp. (in: high G+C Gram-positive bacteria)]|uniref:YtxH domain-containing protein n=1 Tax=Gordonia sp. (in: high G+C Gram-positive bacteria) TaxID=84139 RepID=UPI0039E27039